MITVTLKQINNPGFSTACQKLSQAKLTGKIAYRAAKILEVLNKEVKTGQEAYKKTALKYAETDEKGQLVRIETSPGFKLKEGVELDAFEKEVDDLMATTITVGQFPLPLDALENAEFTPVDILAIEPLIEQPVEEDVL